MTEGNILRRARFVEEKGKGKQKGYGKSALADIFRFFMLMLHASTVIF
jgi:hypothetical protein